VSHQGLDQLEGRAKYLQATISTPIIAISYKLCAIRKIAETKDNIKNIVISNYTLLELVEWMMIDPPPLSLPDPT